MFLATIHKSNSIELLTFRNVQLLHMWLNATNCKKASEFGWYTSGNARVFTERLRSVDGDPRVAVTFYSDGYCGHLAFSSSAAAHEWLRSSGYKEVTDRRTLADYGWYTNGSTSAHYEGLIDLIDCWF